MTKGSKSGQAAQPTKTASDEPLNDATVTDGFSQADLGADEDVPPAYGESFDKVLLSQAGFEAGATVTDDGRVNININQKNRRLSDLLAPTLRNALAPGSKPGSLPPGYIPPSLRGKGTTPPPKLNVVVQIVGSRGDVQPFVALGKVLKETYGHRVRIATHPTFQKFVEENGLEFFSIGGDPAELMAFMVKHPGLMPGFDAIKSGEIKKRRLGIEEIVMGCWRSCIEAGNGLGPPPQQHKPGEPLNQRFNLPGNGTDRPFVADAIIANPPSFAHIHVAEKLGVPLHMMFTMPWSPTRAFPHPLANIQSTNTDVIMTNYVSYALVEMMTWQGLGDVINRFRTKVLDLEPLSLIWAPGLLNRLRIPTTYCWSPALIPKPNDWSNEVTIAGFYFLNLASSYTPEPELAAFLNAGPPPVYIGFGSIVVDDPNKLTKMIFEAVKSTGIRALVSKGWGGLGADELGIPENVFMLGNCPHDWLFKRVAAVVHHGGAGTTAAGIKAGVPTVVVPFFGDQPFWGAMVAKAGAGPDPLPYKELTAEKLATAIQESLKPETKGRARELGEKIREEEGSDVGGESFHEFLDIQNMRCALAPSRVAVWRVRRTETRLSSLAAAVLVQNGVLHYTDLKLYRVREYTTEGQPWDPISAVTAGLIGDISGLAMAVADFPRELFKGNKPKKTAYGKDKSTSDAGQQTELDRPTDNQSSTQTGDTGSETASLATSQPSVSVSQPDDTTLGAESSRDDSSTIVTAPDRTLSPAPKSKSRSRSRERIAQNAAAAGGLTLETAVGAGKSVSRIVGTGMRTPMTVCLGLARGFRNAPKLYNDDTVRPTEKVTDFASGIRVAGKEFGFGFYDGLSGLVTQPMRGAEKEGAAGLIKGIARGVGGLVLKPAAGIWALPGYAMQGVDAEIRNLFSRSSLNYIITSRILQGQEDLAAANAEEQKDILLRWTAKRKELAPFYKLKGKEKESPESQAAQGSKTPQPGEADPEPKTGWKYTKNLSLDERKKLHAQKEAWKKRQADRQATAPGTTAEDPQVLAYMDDDAFEQAIRESVKQTSHGDKEEDRQIEKQIRASVLEMRKIAQQSRDFKQSIPESSAGANSAPESRPQAAGGGGDDNFANITDEEYAELIQRAVQESLKHGTSGPRRHDQTADDDDDNDEDLRRAIAESVSPEGGIDTQGHHDDADLQRALQESEKAHREQQNRSLTEEETVLEYVKKQSLAEEEFRQQKAKGKDVSAQAATDHDEHDDEDEDLKRALEESLKHSDGAGPSVA